MYIVLVEQGEQETLEPRSLFLLKNKNDMFIEKYAKVKNNSEARQLFVAPRNYLIYQRQSQTENSFAQKTKTRVKKARKDIESMHLESFRIAIENEEWGKTFRELTAMDELEKNELEV